MKKYITIGFLFLITFIIGLAGVDAASLSISASTKSVVRGGSVIIRVTASDVMGKMSLTTSNSGVLSGGTSSVWIENETKTYTFKANAAGSATITVKAIDMSDSNGNAYGGSQSITINVYNPAPVVLSSNNNLGGLGVEGKEINPGFSQDTLEYSVEMEPETTKINITGWVADGKASVSGLGEKEVVDGNNRFEIIVTAQNGTTKTYVLNVNVKEYNPIEVDVDDKKYTVIRKKSQLTAPLNYIETTVKIGEEDIHAFHSDITGYDLVGLRDEEGNSGLYVYKNNTYILYNEYQFKGIILYPMDVSLDTIPEGYLKTTITYNEQKINAYKMNEDSNYALIYGMNVETGKTNLYMYDDSEDTLQIYNSEEIDVITEKLELFTLVIACLSGVSFFLFIICIILMISNGKKKKMIKNKDIDIQVTQIKKSKKEMKNEKKLAKELLKNDKFRL